MIKAGFSREIITPSRGITLVGYFNPRPNTGIFDDLYVRVMLFEQNGIVSGMAVYDLCFLSAEIVAEFKSALKKRGFDFADNMMFSAIHTHTGPYIAKFFGNEPSAEYLDDLVAKTVSAVAKAFSSLSPAELKLGALDQNPFAFNRRYWMENGNVLTNPGKLNPNIVKPEGEVNPEIGVMTLEQDGRISAIITHISNHTDTIGGNFVSADWPGRMERYVQNELGYDLPVFSLIDCQGNINHFDVNSGDAQGGYEEACRIGFGYGKIVLEVIDSAKEFKPEFIKTSLRKITVPFRNITDAELAGAEAVLAKPVEGGDGGDMTSEGLATGDGPVARFFAEQMLAYKKNCSGKSREFELISLKFGNTLAITSLPGEAFMEIGEAIRKGSPFKHTWPVVLAMGECGYIPPEECFGRGGYETLPVEGCSPRQDTDKLLVRESIANLNS
ncbi:MAG: hypothetical protein PHR12_04480 [Victivallaceae bacterium]|nr:hypothetical protein [Victivallaceae bacterium]MDD3703468.1 hypothetical protein [Victivallaceae bacterium]